VLFVAENKFEIRISKSLAQTWFTGSTVSCGYVAPLAQTWITGLVAYDKPEHQGRQGRPKQIFNFQNPNDQN